MSNFPSLQKANPRFLATLSSHDLHLEKVNSRLSQAKEFSQSIRARNKEIY